MSSTSGVLTPVVSSDQLHLTQETEAKAMPSQHEWPRLCMVTGSPPGRHGVGQVYTRDLAKRFESAAICTAAVLGNNATWESDTCETLGIEFTQLDRQYETSWKPMKGFFGDVLSQLGWTLKTNPQIKLQSARVATFARQQNSEALLVVLESPFLIGVAAELSRISELPIYTLIWDHPEHVIRSFGHTGSQLKSLLQRAGFAIRTSKNVLVVGEHLKAWVRSSFNKDSAVLRHAIEDQSASPTQSRSEDGPIKIGFAGSVTAPDGFEMLLTTLDQHRWQLDGQKIELHLYGFRYVLESQQPRNIVYHGFMPDTEDVIRELAHCDVTFLPQSFSQREELVTQYSFPTKLSTYLATSRPVLALTPETSEVTAFWNQYEVGPICNDFDSEALWSSLNDAVIRYDKHAKWQAEQSRACKEQFSVEANMNALNQLFASN